MCGNGIRCLARFVADLEQGGPRSYRVHTLAGLIQPELLPDSQVKVDMGEPILEGSKVPTALAPTNGQGWVVEQVRGPMQVLMFPAPFFMVLFNFAAVPRCMLPGAEG